MGKKKKQKNLKKPRAVHLITKSASKSGAVKDYQKISNRLKKICKKKRKKQLMVTSSVPGEGKSTCIANLAITLAKSGKKVLLVDADLQRPTVHKSFSIENQQGMRELLERKVEDIQSLIQSSSVTYLDILPSGEKTKKSGKLLKSKNMKKIITALGKMPYDFILYDLPPVGVVKDGLHIAGRLDGTVLVVREDKVKKKIFKKVLKSLEETETEIIGTIYNEFLEQN